MNISIVIPVYNEAACLDACLLAIAHQSVMPTEVIVVDNNSSDDTIAVARRYPFVTVLRERRQGVVHARNRGFNAARGDIIGRIDADTIISSGWVARLQIIFGDASIAAASGSISYHDLPWQTQLGSLELFFRQRIANGMGDEVFLQGANMGIRRSAWLKIKSTVCNNGGLHEDFDLAIHAQRAGLRVIFARDLRATLSLRRFDSTLIDFWSYAWLSPKTYADHGLTSQRHMYPTIWLIVGFYWLIKLLYHSYDPISERMSLTKLLTPANVGRVNPATFVD
ncbi:MAG: glycosyltransferase family 2 protein [Candidatus Saccharibacteria bacterium]